MNDARTPVIVGTDQLVDREASIERHIQPLDMLVTVATGAARDAGAGDRLLSEIDTIGLVGTAGWHPDNPVNLVAERLGANPARELVTGTGGQVGVTLLNHVATLITQGAAGLAFVGGCNNLKVLMKAIAIGHQLEWTRGGRGAAELIGGDEKGSNELEGQYGLKQPPDIYPLFENALRAKHSLSIAEHNRRMGNLFTRFTEVAADNPYAWFPARRSAEELVTVTPDNRMISFPYPKYLNAVLNTEQAAGVMICSVEKAKALGIPEDRWVYWWGGAHGQEEAWWASERPDFTVCPSMKDTHVSALANAGLEPDAVDYFDFYSCFPVAVEMACEMLSLPVDDPRGFTVTGGLPYAGGPASAYTLHSIAEMAKKLAAEPGRTGLVTGNGWYLTKHSAVVLASMPLPSGRQPSNGLIEDLPSRRMVTAPCVVQPDASGPAVVEAYTVSYARDGTPVRGIVVGRGESGARFLANTPDDPAFLSAWVAEEQVGRAGTVSKAGGLNLFEPA